MQAIDYKRAYALVAKLDALVERDGALHEQFVIDGYDFWQAYRQRVFTFAKEWSRDPNRYVHEMRRPHWKTYVIHIVFTVYSLLSLVIAKVRGIETLVYTTDRINKNNSMKRDARIGPLYDALEMQGEQYLELVHAPYRKESLWTMFVRKRPVIYYEMCVGLGWKNRTIGEIDVSAFSDDEKSIAKDVLTYCMSATVVSKRTMDRLSRIMRFLNSKRIFSIDDPRYYHEVIAAGEKSNVQTYAFQHGHITKYHLGWLAFGKPLGKTIAPHRLYVWSEYWKRELIRLKTHIPHDAIKAASSIATHTPKHMHTPTSEMPLTVVVPYETDAPKDEVRSFIQALGSCSLFRVQFKARADMSLEAQLREYDITDPEKFNLEVVTVISYAQPTIVIGTYSTYLYDMIAQYVPVGFLESSIDFGEALVHNNLAERIPQDHTVCKRIVEAFEKGLEERVVRHSILVDTNAPTHADIVKQIVNETHT